MFTGIVDHMGIIEQIAQGARSQVIWISSQFNDLTEGESIAVDGICLTVIEPKLSRFRCDISPETWQLSNAKNFLRGKTVNLERSLQVSDRLGGHFVTGHVDQTASIGSQKSHDEFLELTIKDIPSTAMSYVIKKGSIAINGVSLTINQVFQDGFSVMLIPHTLSRTNLSQLNPQDFINIEFDWIAKVIAHQIQLYQEKINDA
jgi:riboflavin synthase